MLVTRQVPVAEKIRSGKGTEGSIDGAYRRC
jgi:hypothetical protein